MKIRAFQNYQEEDLKNNGQAWYITTGDRKILYLTGNQEGLLNDIKSLKIPAEDIDIIMLAQGCWNAVRELEYFLKRNSKVKIYLPRKSNEKELRALYYKVKGYCKADYTGPDALTQLTKQVIFMDDVTNIGEGIQAFEEKIKESGKRAERSSLILTEGTSQILFSYSMRYTAKYIKEEAESFSGRKVDYFFLWDEQGECVLINCTSREKNELLMGQVVDLVT